MTISPFFCARCLHKDADDTTCAAFPDGIPTPILLVDADHRHPYPGDLGLHFVPRDERAARDVAAFDRTARGGD